MKNILPICCQKCQWHDERMRDGGHCYMFKCIPLGKLCGQFKEQRPICQKPTYGRERKEFRFDIGEGVVLVSKRLDLLEQELDRLDVILVKQGKCLRRTP